MSCRKDPLSPSSGPLAATPASGTTTLCSLSDPRLCDMLAFMCPQDRAFLDDLRARGVTVTTFDRLYFEDPYYDGTQWTTRHFEAGGTTSSTDINMLMGTDAGENAATLYHEGIHTGQPSTMRWRDKEYQAYIAEDQWRISHGLPPSDPSFRTHDSTGRPVTDTAAIGRFVEQRISWRHVHRRIRGASRAGHWADFLQETPSLAERWNYLYTSTEERAIRTRDPKSVNLRVNIRSQQINYVVLKGEILHA